MKKITLEQLIQKKACHDQMFLFRQHFGEEVEVTIERASEVAQIFNWNWAAVMFLNKEQYEAYEAAIQPAWEAYEAAIQPAWEAYKAAIQPAQEAYQAVEQPAREAYNRAKAEAFVTSLLKQ